MSRRIDFVERHFTRRLPRDEQSWLRETFGEFWWHDYAVCRSTDPEAFFPEKGGQSGPAKRTCGGCIVSDACLQWAVESGEEFGIWGGLTADERRPLAGKVRRHEPAVVAALAGERGAGLAAPLADELADELADDETKDVAA